MANKAELSESLEVPPGTPLLSLRPSWRGVIRHLLALLLLAVLIAIVLGFRWWVEPDDWGGVGAWLYAHPIVPRILAGLLGLVALYLIFKVLTRRWRLKLTVYHDRLTLEKGILDKDVKVVFCADIRTINVRQSLMQRMLHVGDLYVATAGTEGYEDQAMGMAQPKRLKNRILELKRRAAATDD